MNRYKIDLFSNSISIIVDIDSIMLPVIEFTLYKGSSNLYSSDLNMHIYRNGIDSKFIITDEDEFITLVVPIGQVRCNITLVYQVPCKVTIGDRGKTIVYLSDSFFYAYMKYILFLPKINSQDKKFEMIVDAEKDWKLNNDKYMC